MSAGVWYGKRTWLGLGFALVLALALDALGALLLARGGADGCGAGVDAGELGGRRLLRDADGRARGVRVAAGRGGGRAGALWDRLGGRARRVADGGLSLGCDGGGVRRAAARGTA